MTEPEEPVRAYQACKPMLPGNRELIAGYIFMHHQEAKYTAIALKEMPEAVATWYRYLELFNQAIRREHESGETGPTPAWFSWHLRIHLVATATGTAKLTLDAGLAGYYSQAFALIRHMLETWRQMVYARLFPSEADRWYTLESGRPPCEPGRNTIKKELDKYAKRTGDRELKQQLAVVTQKIENCDDGAHPSAMAVAQLKTGKPGFSQLGANYIESQSAALVSIGTFAIALLLDELQKLVALDETWSDELRDIHQQRDRWHERYAQSRGDEHI
jgi:hypothetical protein